MVHMRAKPLRLGWEAVLIMKSDAVPVVGHMLLSPGHGLAGGLGGVGCGGGGRATASFSIKKLH